MIKGIFDLYKVILVRVYDHEHDKLFHAVYTSGSRTQFKKGQVISEAFARKTTKDTSVMVNPDVLTIGDIVYVNQFGWVEIVRN